MVQERVLDRSQHFQFRKLCRFINAGSAAINFVSVRLSCRRAISSRASQNAKFWAGERYYRRQHIDSDDFFPLDMSGYGGGVEDLDLKFGKAAVAFIGVARPDVVTQNGNLATSHIDATVYDVKGPSRLYGACGLIMQPQRVVKLDLHRVRIQPTSQTFLRPTATHMGSVISG